MELISAETTLRWKDDLTNSFSPVLERPGRSWTLRYMGHSFEPVRSQEIFLPDDWEELENEVAKWQKEHGAKIL